MSNLTKKNMPAATTDERLLRNDWSLLVITNNGTVSLIRHMPLREAVKVYGALHQERMPNCVYYPRDSDIERREILGPEGWDGCHAAMQHNVTYAESLIEEGPKKGKTFRSGKCCHCGQHKSEIVETQLDANQTQ